jgi:hypothetical protein
MSLVDQSEIGCHHFSMSKITFKLCLMFFAFSVLSLQAQAQEKQKVSRFLNSCMYGTATGALLGMASLAFVGDPAGSMGNIARGASLGLYAGIGMGFYYMDQESPSVTVYPKIKENKINGVDFVWNLARF